MSLQVGFAGNGRMDGRGASTRWAETDASQHGANIAGRWMKWKKKHDGSCSAAFIIER